MDARTAKLALARQKLKSHQEKKQVLAHKDENTDVKQKNIIPHSECDSRPTDSVGANNEQLKFELQTDSHEKASSPNNNNVNVTEVLISTKHVLEIQINELQSKLSQLENNYTLVVNNNSYCKQQITSLENDLKSYQEAFEKAKQDILHKDSIIQDLNKVKLTLQDENNHLQEQLEFTKTILTTKDSENVALQNQIIDLNSQLDATQLQLQQMTNGVQMLQVHQVTSEDPDQNPEILRDEISRLELELKSNKKEKEQMTVHYEHYIHDLSEQLKAMAKQNSDLENELQKLSVRETALVEHISEMEIQIQTLKQKPVENYSSPVLEKNETDLCELRKINENLQEQVKILNDKCGVLESKYLEGQMQLQEIKQIKEAENDHDNISLSKLTADMASDKLAAQKATEQNKKLKIDLQKLEDAFVKISRDKLELTEKVAAEKFLNRELTIKLSEVEEKAKDMHRKLLAKDEEMIRLLNSYRGVQKSEPEKDNGATELINNPDHCSHGQDHYLVEHSDYLDKTDCNNECSEQENILHKTNINAIENDSKLPNRDAMMKLQDRFLKIMDEVANLSDEKHRLEHIILQLQTETDTICEYVALYQQQRSLLKKRDEERSAQIKIFQEECNQLKRQLEELSGIIIKLAQDIELAAFFQTEPRQSDLAKVMNLLSNLKSNSLIDPCKTNSEFKNFYPCSCCSGQLIEV